MSLHSSGGIKDVVEVNSISSIGHKTSDTGSQLDGRDNSSVRDSDGVLVDVIILCLFLDYC